MNLYAQLRAESERLRRKPVVAVVAAVALIAVAAIFINSTRPVALGFNSYEVKQGDFLISVVEGGTVEAVREQSIRSEVEGTARIVYIVPEGTYVKKDQLLVSLDSSASQDAVNQQQINVEKADFAHIQAQQQLEIQKSIVDSEVSAAKLKVEFAQSDLDKYVKGEMLQARRNSQIDITNVLENLKIAEERLEWTDALYKDGYETKSNLDKDRLTVSQTKLKLEQAEQALWMLQTFDEPKKKRTLEASLQEAQDNLDRVRLQGERKLAQFQADVETQKSTLELSRRKLERDQKQLQATRIVAPQDGLVVYATGGGHFSSESMIEEGAVVRYRQEIIKLPDISEMKLSVKVHESYVNHVRLGQPAYVVMDAMPDRRFRGEIMRVAPLPDSQSRWGNPNLKVYATEILITDKLPDVKPGVSARAEIVITNLLNVLTAPIQAVTTRKGQQVVFLESAPQRPVPVQVGYYNAKFIEITSGLKAGARVLLSPPFDTEGKDLAGSIITKGDALPTATNANRAAQFSARTREENGSPGLEEGRGRRERASSEALSPGGGPGPGLRPGSEPPGGREDRRRGPGLDLAGPLGQPGSEAARGPEGGRGEGQRGGRGRFNREGFMKQFDTNGDGQLDEKERAAVQERFGRDRGRPGASTNAPPTQLPAAPDANR
jgi:HlyD family secretion protein